MHQEVFTRERCFIRELANAPGTGEFSLAEARVEPGVTTELHRLTVAEWYVITQGAGRVEIDGTASDVQPGDTVAIPAGTPQRITNTGPGDLVFLCVCLPRFTEASYEAME